MSSTSQICTDKASTLTLNQMTARVLVARVSFVDPPARLEARDVVAQCRDGGIRVRMIIDDHAARRPCRSGVDPVSPDAMRRPPRRARKWILTRPRLLRILLASTVMAAGTLIVLANPPGPEPQLGVAAVASTIVPSVSFQVFTCSTSAATGAARSATRPWRARSAFVAAVVVVVVVLIVEMNVLHGSSPSPNSPPVNGSPALRWARRCRGRRAGQDRAAGHDRRRRADDIGTVIR